MKGLWPTALFVALAFSGCLDPEIHYANLKETLAGEYTQVHGVLLFKKHMLEGRFAGPNGTTNWSAWPVIDYAAPPMVVKKRDPGPMGGGGVVRGLAANLTEYRLQVRVREPERFEGYTIAWSRRLGTLNEQFRYRPEQEPVVPCENMNLNAPRRHPWNEPYSSPINLPGMYVLQAEVLRGEARVAILCMPLVARVNASWHVESSIQPVGADLAGITRTNDYDKMLDGFAFDVGRTVSKYEKRPLRGRLEVVMKFVGDSSADRSAQVDLAIIDPKQFYNSVCRGRNTATSELTFRQNIDREGVWLARVGAVCPGDLIPAAYYNPVPVQYTLDIKLRYGCAKMDWPSDVTEC